MIIASDLLIQASQMKEKTFPWATVFHLRTPVKCATVTDEAACKGADKCIWTKKKCEVGFEPPPARYVLTVLDPKTKNTADLHVCGKGQSRNCDKWMFQKVADCSGRYYVFTRDRIFGTR